jgi:hypothetical protein
MISVTRPLFAMSVLAFASVHAFTPATCLAAASTVFITVTRNANQVIVAHAGRQHPAEFRARARSAGGIGQTVAAGIVAVALSGGSLIFYDGALGLIAALGLVSALATASLPGSVTPSKRSVFRCGSSPTPTWQNRGAHSSWPPTPSW